MTINIQYLQKPTSESLYEIEIVSRNLRKLSHKYQFIIHADVFFKIGNDPTGSGRICEIQLHAPSPSLFAKANENNFEKAAVASLDNLDRQLQKHKEKLNNHKKAI